VHLTWWVFDVPILWKNRPADEGHDPYPENNLTRTKRNAAAAAIKANDRLGLGGFLLSIAWACLRANAPGCAALYALMAGRDTGEYAAIYYLGVRRLRDGRAPEFTTWKLTTSIGTDLLNLVVVGVTVYQACTLPEYAPRQLGAGMWAYPSLPTALIGLCLLAGRYWFLRTLWAAVGLVLMVMGVVVLVGVALALLLWRLDRPNDGWFFPVICYGAMAFPAVLFGVPFILLATAYGCFSRVGGVTLAAWQHYAGGQPFCKIPGIGFAVVYLALGGISALLALLAIVLYQTDIGWWISYSSLDPRAELTGGSDLGRNIGERRVELTLFNIAV
jgi:hypothetical protein